MQVLNRQIWLGIIGAGLLLVLALPVSVALLDLRFDYTLQTVTVGGAALGALAGVVGCFAVLRQQSMVGDALSHAALPGVAIAFLLAGREIGALLIGAAVSGWLGVMFVRALTSTTRIKQDTALGIVLSAWFALGIALLTYIQGRPDASQAGLDTFIFGQAASIRQPDLVLIFATGAAVALLLALLWKEFKLVTFDAAFARANGFPTRIIDLLLSTLIVAVIVLGLRLAGVILMVGLLIAPAAAARQWTNQLGQMLALAGIFGAFAGGAGALISAVDVDVPTGPMIIVVASIIVAVSIVFAPQRGVLWSRRRARVARQG